MWVLLPMGCLGWSAGVFMGYLHRIVNGGGYIDREYGVGRGRIDLLIRWPHTD